MIHILLLILKIVGILLLVVLCLALLILFYPITYVGNVEIKDKLVYGKLRAGWLFHIIHFGMRFEKSTVSYALRVLGITVASSKEKNKEHDSSEEKNIQINVIKDKNTKVVSDDETDRKRSFPDKEQKVTTENITKDEAENVTNAEAEGNTESQKKSLIEKAKELFEKIKTKVLDIFKNIKKYCKKAKEIKEFLTANTTKEAYNYGKQIIIKFIRHIFPNKIRGRVEFGFEQPHLTGQTLGYIAMGFSMFHINPKHIVIEPDFEQKILVGNVRFKGRIILGLVVYYILKLYFKKEINEIIKKFK